MVQEHSECPSCVCVYPPQLCVQRGLQCGAEPLSRNTGPSAGLASGREEMWVNGVCIDELMSVKGLFSTAPDIY